MASLGQDGSLGTTLLLFQGLVTILRSLES